MTRAKIIKIPSIRRLPRYLRVLHEMKLRGREVVSSAHLAKDLDIEQIVVKKDLELIYVKGKIGVGYQVNELIEAIETFFGWNNMTDAFLVGAGNLGNALIGYEGFRKHGLNIIAAFDTDSAKIGNDNHGVSIFPITKLPSLAQRMHVKLAVLTVPGMIAQEITDMLVDAGICGIWNFTPVHLNTPDDVVVQQEDLSAGLAELTIKLLHRESNK